MLPQKAGFLNFGQLKIQAGNRLLLKIKITG